MKFKHLLANKPKVTSDDKNKLLNKREKLQELRQKKLVKTYSPKHSIWTVICNLEKQTGSLLCSFVDNNYCNLEKCMLDHMEVQSMYCG